MYMSIDVLFWLTGLALWSLIPLSIFIAIVWYLFSAVCTIIFVHRIAAYSNFKNKKGEPIPFSNYVQQFRYWQHCTGQSYHVTIAKTGEKIWMPWPYGTKKYRKSTLAREQAELNALIPKDAKNGTSL